jgi:hypothetical protein
VVLFGTLSLRFGGYLQQALSHPAGLVRKAPAAGAWSEIVLDERTSAFHKN